MDARLPIRPATLQDLPGIRAILAAHGNDGPVTTVDIVGPYVTHLLTHSRVLLTVDGPDIVAYGAVHDAGVSFHLADLFVRPDRLGQGIGRRLLAELFGDARRRTTFASDDPRALPLYVRAGMIPFWPTLYLEGDGAAVPGVGRSVELEPADAVRLAALEGAWTGHDRSVDHAFWASQPEADAFVVHAGGEPAAIAIARARQVSPVRIIDHLVVRPDADPVPPTLAALRRGARGGRIMATIEGPSPLLRPLLEAGFRIADQDLYLASEPGLIDPARLIPNGGML